MTMIAQERIDEIKNGKIFIQDKRILPYRIFNKNNLWYEKKWKICNFDSNYWWN